MEEDTCGPHQRSPPFPPSLFFPLLSLITSSSCFTLFLSPSKSGTASGFFWVSMERWEGRQKAPFPLPSAAEWMRDGDEDCGGDKKRGSGCAGMKGCQADKCGADLRDSKPYHRRHKVCEPHAKAAAVLVAGIHQRFCQQCSRFHELSEFDESKRSCRTRLAGHNERRRKNTVEQVGPSSGRREMVCGSGVQMEDLHLPMSMPEKAGYKQHFQIR